MSEVHIKDRPALHTATQVGQELRDYIEARGLSMSWQRVDEHTQWHLQARGISPLDVNDIKSDDPKLHKSTKALYSPNAEGFIRRGDTLLCVQSLEIKTQLADAEEHRRQLMESGGRATEAAQEMVAQTAHAHGLPEGDYLQGEVPELAIEVEKGRNAARLNIPQQQ